MEVDDFELLELVNDYQERCEVSTFNTLYYLEKYGFNDTDCLEDYTLDLITEEVYKILKLWKQEN